MSHDPARDPDEVERRAVRKEDEPDLTVEAEELEPPDSDPPAREEPDRERPTPAPRRRGAIDGFF